MEESHTAGSGGEQPRKRSVTSLTLGWIADRLRRAETIKEQVESGQYCVESAKVAKSLVNDDE